MAKSSVSTTSTSTENCPECGGSIVVEESQAESRCADCGLVIKADKIDPGPEWRAFDSEERSQKRRVGSPLSPSLHDRGLSTTIGHDTSDSYGQQLSPAKLEQLSRLRREQRRAVASETKNGRHLRKALGEIDRMASALDIGQDTKDTASVIYRVAVDKDLLPGRSIEAVATAAVLIACRQHNIPRTVDEIFSTSRVERKPITRAKKYLSKELELEVPPPNPTDYIPAIASELNIPDSLRLAAKALLEEFIDASLHSGKSPAALAGGSIYAANTLLGKRIKLTQDEVATTTSHSRVTIREHYQDMVQLDKARDVCVDAAQQVEPDISHTSLQTAAQAPIQEISIECDGDSCVIQIPESESQSNVYLTAVNHMIECHDLFEHISSLPYKMDDRLQNYQIVADPDMDAPDQAATWKELTNGTYLTTKPPKDRKTALMEQFASMCDITLQLNGW